MQGESLGDPLVDDVDAGSQVDQRGHQLFGDGDGGAGGAGRTGQPGWRGVQVRHELLDGLPPQ
jgi:hypothetical protein